MYEGGSGGRPATSTSAQQQLGYNFNARVNKLLQGGSRTGQADPYQGQQPPDLQVLPRSQAQGAAISGLTNLNRGTPVSLQQDSAFETSNFGGKQPGPTPTFTQQTTKKLKDLEYRQKIFEEEIINRVKEIQRYVKSLHLTLKKTQQTVAENDMLVLETQDQLVKKDISAILPTLKGAEGFASGSNKMMAALQKKMSLQISDQMAFTIERVKSEILPRHQLEIAETLKDDRSEIRAEFGQLQREAQKETSDTMQLLQNELRDRMARAELQISQALQAEQSTKMLQMVENIDIQVKAQLQRQLPPNLLRSSAEDMPVKQGKHDPKTDVQFQDMEQKIAEMADDFQSALARENQSTQLNFLAKKDLNKKLEQIVADLNVRLKAQEKRTQESLETIGEIIQEKSDQAVETAGETLKEQIDEKLNEVKEQIEYQFKYVEERNSLINKDVTKINQQIKQTSDSAPDSDKYNKSLKAMQDKLLKKLAQNEQNQVTKAQLEELHQQLQEQLDSKCEHEDLDNLPLQDQETTDLMKEQIEGLKDNQIRGQGQMADLEQQSEQMTNNQKQLQRQIDDHSDAVDRVKFEQKDQNKVITKNLQSLIRDERSSIDEALSEKMNLITSSLEDLKTQQHMLESQISQVEKESKLLPAQLKFEIPQLIQQHLPKPGSPKKQPVSSAEVNEATLASMEQVAIDAEDTKQQIEFFKQELTDLISQLHSLTGRVSASEDENLAQRLELVTEMVDDHKDQLMNMSFQKGGAPVNIDQQLGPLIEKIRNLEAGAGGMGNTVPQGNFDEFDERLTDLEKISEDLAEKFQDLREELDEVQKEQVTAVQDSMKLKNDFTDTKSKVLSHESRLSKIDEKIDDIGRAEPSPTKESTFFREPDVDIVARIQELDDAITVLDTRGEKLIPYLEQRVDDQIEAATEKMRRDSLANTTDEVQQVREDAVEMITAFRNEIEQQLEKLPGGEEWNQMKEEVTEIADDYMISNDNIVKRLDQLTKDIEEQTDFQEKRNTEFLNILGQVEDRLNEKVNDVGERYQTQLDDLTQGNRKDLSLGPLSNSRPLSPLGYQLSAPQHARKITSGTQGRNDSLEVMGVAVTEGLIKPSSKLNIQIVNDSDAEESGPYGDHSVDPFKAQSPIEEKKSTPTEESSPMSAVEMDEIIQIEDIVLESVATGHSQPQIMPSPPQVPVIEKVEAEILYNYGGVVKVAPPPAKKKFNREDYMFATKQNETLVKQEGQIEGKAFNIRYLDNCNVFLYDHSAQINVDQCNDCTMVIGPVKNSIFVRDCNNCVIHVACSQFRCRDLTNSTIYLYAMNDPVIEASSGLTFAPYNITYHGLAKQAELAGLDPSANKWELLFDFSIGQNFKVMDPAEFQLELKEAPGYEEADTAPAIVFGYPKRYGGQLSDNLPVSSAAHDNLSAFDIRTGQVQNNNKKAAEEEKQKQVVHISIGAEPIKADPVIQPSSQPEIMEPPQEMVPIPQEMEEPIKVEEFVGVTDNTPVKQDSSDYGASDIIGNSVDKFFKNEDNLGESFDQEGLGSSLASEEQQRMGGFLKTLAKNNTMDRQENSSRSNQFADVERELEALGFQGPGSDEGEDSEIEGMDLPINLGVNIKQGFGGNLEGFDILSGLSPEKEELSKEDMINGVVEGLINDELFGAVHLLHQNRQRFV